MHPDVDVTMECEFEAGDENLDDAERLARSDAFRKRLLLEMESGEGFDVVDVSGLNYHDLFARELFDDLYAYMDRDAGFLREDYFENIFGTLESFGALYAFPPAVRMDFVSLNKSITGALDIDTALYSVITPMQILEIYGQALDAGFGAQYPDEEDGERFLLSCYGTDKAALWEELYSYLDVENRVAEFDSPEFAAYLEASQRVRRDNSKAFWHMTSPSFPGANALRDSNTLMYKFFSVIFRVPEMLAESDYSTSAIPLGLGKRGAARMFTASRLLSIAENGENKAVAWEFIKYCAAESDIVNCGEGLGQWYGDRFESHLPTNRNNLEKYVAAMQKKYPNNLSADEVPDACAMLESWMEALNTAPPAVDLCIFDDIMWAYYFEESITTQECAQQIQARAEEILGG